MQPSEPGSEKRTFVRQDVMYPVRFRSEMLEFESKAELIGEVLDMSEGGLFVRSEYLEAPGTPVWLQVWLPSSPEPIALRGNVAWVAEHPPKGPGMGIRLTLDWA
jgi:Tfp pilus assembly protein PilZ